MVKREYVKVPLETTDIKSIQPFNRAAASRETLALQNGPILIITAVVIINDFGMWKDDDKVDLGLQFFFKIKAITNAMAFYLIFKYCDFISARRFLLVLRLPSLQNSGHLLFRL